MMLLLLLLLLLRRPLQYKPRGELNMPAFPAIRKGGRTAIANGLMLFVQNRVHVVVHRLGACRTHSMTSWSGL